MLTPSSAYGKVSPDMGRNVLITIEIPLSLREKVRASWKRNGQGLKEFYTELFKLGVEVNEESKSTGDKVLNPMGQNRRAKTS